MTMRKAILRGSAHCHQLVNLILRLQNMVAEYIIEDMHVAIIIR